MTTVEDVVGGEAVEEEVVGDLHPGEETEMVPHTGMIEVVRGHPLRETGMIAEEDLHRHPMIVTEKEITTETDENLCQDQDHQEVHHPGILTEDLQETCHEDPPEICQGVLPEIYQGDLLEICHGDLPEMVHLTVEDLLETVHLIVEALQETVLPEMVVTQETVHQEVVEAPETTDVQDQCHQNHHEGIMRLEAVLQTDTTMAMTGDLLLTDTEAAVQ